MREIEDEAQRRNTISIRLPQWIIDWLRVWQKEGQSSMGELIEHALIEHYRISQTKPLLRR